MGLADDLEEFSVDERRLMLTAIRLLAGILPQVPRGHDIVVLAVATLPPDEESQFLNVQHMIMDTLDTPEARNVIADGIAYAIRDENIIGHTSVMVPKREPEEQLPIDFRH